ncbi:MAG TPA: choice-of-anchor tandem repeat GloVer-containing protein [Rhizomicrobium sp.]|jgi:uncharacterized repeat protein (TIGR03803 family)|nr:choice-of-anchor tandem repeat GloVer-containing protein [Rhizomicrobium sp.]
MFSNRTCLASAFLAPALAFALFTPAAHAGTGERVLHSFSGSDGSYPNADLAFDAGSNLYGTASNGGDSNWGTIFKLDPVGNYSVLYSFTGGADGQTPAGGVTIDDATGDLYGTATFGGEAANGVIYKLSATGKLTVLHAFDGANDGASPAGTLVRDKVGNFYGAAEFGGTGDDGTIFKLTAKGKLTVLHAFNGSDGIFPQGTLVRDRAGDLYGIAGQGGASGAGTVYRVAADGTFTLLYAFSGSSDGGYPVGGLALDKQGNLYGTTQLGGTSGTGVIFELSPKGKETVLYNFTDGSDGAFPQGDLLRDKSGALYGTAESGGIVNCEGISCGTVFELAPGGTYKVLYSFLGGDDGAFPYAGLTAKGKKLFGTTYLGGGSHNCMNSSCGTVFSVKKQ